MNRRSFLALGLLSTLLVAAPRMAAAEGDAAAAKPGKELNLFAWSEYVPQAVIDGFTAETGIQVNYETYASNEEMLAKLVSGAQKYDLIQPSEYTIEALIKHGGLLPVDWSKVPNIRNIGSQYRNLSHDPEQKYSVPWMVGSVGIVVNTEKVKEPIRGYADVFQKKYAGRIVVLDDPREIVTAPENEPAGRDHRIRSLFVAELGVLFDPVERRFGRAAKDREHRAARHEIDGVIAPFPFCDLSAVEVENHHEFKAIESDDACRRGI